MEAYFDNSATTRCAKSVMDVMARAYAEDYGNPSSLHRKGIEAEGYVRKARQQIARTLKVKESELIFTSGGTESNNLAILGAAMANQRAGKHLVTTKIEHPSVEEPMRFLERQGFSVTFLDVGKDGRISPDELRDALTPDTILVSIMHVNNEIGAVEPIGEAAGIIHEKCPSALFHVDAVQSYGKYEIFPSRMGIDMLSVSGHKIHGPKGVGLLYVNGKAKVSPILFGGGQQRGFRSGTENVPGIAGLGQAAEEAYDGLEGKREHLYALREAFLEGVGKEPWARVNGRTDREGAPHIVSLSVDGVKSEVLLHALEEKGVFVSSGSACASNKPGHSATLAAIGAGEAALDSTVRISFSTENTMEEVEYCLRALGEIVPRLQKYTRR